MRRRDFLATATAAVITPCAVLASEAVPLLMSGGLGLAPVAVAGGEPHRFLMDTGADTTVMDQSLSVALGVDRMLPKAGPVRANATGVSLAGRTGFVSPVVADLAGIAVALGQPVMGLLGSDFFSGFNLQLDYAASTMRLDTGKMAKGPRAMGLRFDGIPYVRAELRVGGQTLAAEFGLDTGLDTGVKIFPGRARDALGGLKTVPGQTLTMKGMRPQALAPVDSLRVGGLDISNLTANLSDDPPPRGAGPDMIGMIGAPAFARRVMTLDIAGGWWSLSPLVL